MIRIIELSSNDDRLEKIIPLVKKLNSYQERICPLVEDFSKDTVYDKSIFRGNTVMVAYDDNDPIGYLEYMKYKKNNIFLNNLFVDEKYRSKGIGALLVKALKNKMGDKIKGIIVGVLDNPPAIKFYQSNGFKIVDCQGYIDLKRHQVSGDDLTFKEKSKNSVYVFLNNENIGYFTHYHNVEKERIFSINELKLDNLPNKVNIVKPIKKAFPKVQNIFIYYKPDKYPSIKHNLEQLQFKLFGYDMYYKK